MNRRAQPRPAGIMRGSFLGVFPERWYSFQDSRSCSGCIQAHENDGLQPPIFA